MFSTTFHVISQKFGLLLGQCSLAGKNVGYKSRDTVPLKSGPQTGFYVFAILCQKLRFFKMSLILEFNANNQNRFTDWPHFAFAYWRPCRAHYLYFKKLCIQAFPLILSLYLLLKARVSMKNE